MKKNALKISFAALLLIAGIVVGQNVSAQYNPIPKNYDGIVTQVYTDGSFSLRMRGGSSVIVAPPLLQDMFVTVKGILDPTGKSMSGVTQITKKNPVGSDAIPVLSIVDPGSAQIGETITLTGTGFTKKTNSVSIGDIKYALINLQSKDGKTITFQLPSSPCNQKTKTKTSCPTSVITPGNYDIIVSNENGVTNSTPFHILPLPPLALTTDMLAQAMARTRYSIKISAIGGAESYNWRITEGTLPPGMILSRAACSQAPCRTDGVISGVSLTPGTYQFTVTLVSGQETTSRQFSIVVVQPLNNPY